ncbi:MAG: single-stranded DNA-binding protein [Propionicimonas sp.]
MEAQVWLTGRVGGEVELRDAASPWATFRLGCTPRTVRGGEWGDEQTIWVTVSCSHRLAEHVRQSLHKGDPVIVVGRLRSRHWVDANGVEHDQLQIRASTVGHDLTAGTSNFYRVKRTQPGEIVEPGENDAEAAEESYQPEGEETGELDIESLAALAAEEFEADQEEATLAKA